MIGDSQKFKMSKKAKCKEKALVNSMRKFILKNHIQDYIKFPESAWEKMDSVLKYNSVDKGINILNIGQIENSIRFIITGLIKITHNKDGRSSVYDFRGKNSFACDPISLFEQSPTLFSFETITPCEWLTISGKDINTLFSNDKSINKAYGHFMHTYLKRSQDSQALLRSHSAKERYIYLFNNHPEVIKHASLSDISSYLGIKLPSLSRIRKELVNLPT